ncbi:MAG: hypothetical protein DID91_2727704368 [Candidatus Nitrotoga sp. MKT]|nr:MAG: hypothetical protein DID91_2727704368 [Candidatus Nitrotoga sp. MKT]
MRGIDQRAGSAQDAQHSEAATIHGCQLNGLLK